MAEEVRITDYGVSATGAGGGGGGGEDDERVSEWEDGLPNVDDLTPLSQSLISSELLYAFSITPEPYRSMIDVNRASQNTLSNLRGEIEQQSFTRFDTSKSCGGDKGDEAVVEGEETADLTPGGSGGRKLQRIGSGGGVDGGGAVEETESDLQADDPSSRVSKRPRLVWTPQLHKRFIEVVAHLGVKNAVPKTIMQLMNVEGLTRENVASHLQKYRLYLKRMQSLPTQGSSSSDAGGGDGYHGPPAVVPVTYPPQMVHHMPYNAAVQHQRNWGGSKLDAVAAYHHGMTPNNK